MAGLGAHDTDARALALLFARHWRPTYEYSVICLASSTSTAAMAATAAFHRVLGRPTGGALRPQLLAAVRDTAKEWAADDGISALLPELGKPTGGRGLLAARAVTPERRRLAERAFQALPGASQCLLWHTEVEAEPISVPAGLLGVDTGTATAAKEQAREQFRAGCVRAHRELAPSRECRFYNRLLDVPIRRGGALLPDVQKHLTQCRFCRHAAEQLSHFEDALDVLLAETVLGWGARRYLDSRPGRGGGLPPSAEPGARPRAGGRHRPPTGSLAVPRRPSKAVVVGAGVTSLALLVTVLAARGWSDEGVSGPRATWGVPSVSSAGPGVTSESSSASAGSPSAALVGRSGEIGHGRLRNLDVDLCLGVRDGRIEDGAETALTACSSAESQQWSYQDDGLLRSAADPTLCLDSDADTEAVVLADCLVHAGEVRYDLTVRGELLLRRGEGLLVAPGAGRHPVVTARNGSTEQRWLLEPSGGGTGATEKKDDSPSGRPGSPLDEPTSPDGIAPPPPDGGSPPWRPEDAPQQQPQYETRVAQVDHGTGSGSGTDTGSGSGSGTVTGHDEPPKPSDALAADALASGALDTASSVVGTATTALGSLLG
ncbi:ricin-type beta-trefoil lectin domain protein [Streptomyces sp. NPDC087903]|uniref:ricin-type beta-trefoil lectin domain protein n=1 Tax=Streptomyces sp. NPDC087903 TaxID=3365819 RepID=UPI0038037CD5